MKSALSKLRSNVRIPGFRRGKTPIALVEKRFGKEAEGEVVENLIPKYYSMALKEAAMTPIAHPKIESEIEIKRNSPFNVTLLVEIMPKIENLEYEGISVKGVTVEVNDSDVESALSRFQEEKAVYEPSEKPVSKGDLVVIDYETKDSGETFSDEVFIVGSERMPEEFSTNMIDMNKADEVEFDVQFPEDFANKDMAGKKLGFKVTVKDVKKVILPEIDDEFAKDMNYESLDELKGKVRERLEKSRDEMVANIQKAEVLKKLLEGHEFEAPESLVETELERLIENARAGGAKDSDEIVTDEQRPIAERHVKSSVLLDLIGKKEEVVVSEDDIKGRLGELSLKHNLSPENVIKYYVARDGSLDGLKRSMFEDKVLDLLLERAVIEKGD
jgi:trigger factor